MKISFSTGALFPSDTLDSLDLLYKAGFEYAELMPQCYEEILPEFGKKLRDKKIKISSIHYPLVFFSTFYNPYKKMTEDAERMTDNITELAYICGAEVIVIHPLQKMDTERRNIFFPAYLENMRHLCEKAGKAGVTVALENNPYSEGDTPDNLKTQVSIIDSPYCFPMLDTTESFEGKILPEVFLKDLDPCHIHLSDYTSGNKHIPAGEGEMNLKKFLSLLKQKIYNKFLVLEPSYKYYMTETEEKLKRDFERINTLLNRIQ